MTHSAPNASMEGLRESFMNGNLLSADGDKRLHIPMESKEIIFSWFASRIPALLKEAEERVRSEIIEGINCLKWEGGPNQLLEPMAVERHNIELNQFVESLSLTEPSK